MALRVQVVLDEAERERFRREALAEGMSLSGWLREAARERLARRRNRRLRTAEELDAFFAECNARNRTPEPVWEEHLAVIAGSRARGAAGS